MKALASQPCHALICIREGRQRGLFSLLLTDQGCRVTSCAEAGEGLRHAADDPPDLCVLSASEPEAAKELLCYLRNKNVDTQVLLLAEPKDAESLPRLFKLGIDELVFLPVNARRCMEMLRGMLKGPELQGESERVTSFAGSHQPRRSAVLPVRQDANALPAEGETLRALLQTLHKQAKESQAVILRGEHGSEFELIAREFHRARGGEDPCIPLLDAHEINEENLRNTIALARLHEDSVCTLHLRNLEQLDAAQQADLSAVLVSERRRRLHSKPVGFVLSFKESSPQDEPHFIEELLFHTPTLLRIPPLRDRPEDLEGIARYLLRELSTIFPKVRARNIEPAALDWMRSKIWTGNHEQFTEVLREAILTCPHASLDANTLARLSESQLEKVGAKSALKPAAVA